MIRMKQTCYLEEFQKQAASRILVIRHGERLDEINHEKFQKYVDEMKPQYPNIRLDPPLTETGSLQAQTMTGTVASIVSEEPNKPSAIYASKLQRSVKTAYELAKVVGLPIVVSYGFAQTACAVEEAGPSFLFLPMDYLRSLCPGVELIDGDAADSPIRIPCDSNWFTPISYVSQRDPFSIIVAHRETIKGLSMNHSRVSYCGIGDYDVEYEFEIDEAEGGESEKLRPEEGREDDGKDSKEEDEEGVERASSMPAGYNWPTRSRHWIKCASIKIKQNSVCNSDGSLNTNFCVQGRVV